MKLLTDEHFSPAIAKQLRERGHDVIAIQELPGGRTSSDPELFSEAQRLGRALLTENVADFLAIDAEHRARGLEHFGLVMTTNRSFPRSKGSTLGALVKALDALLAAQPGSVASGQVIWLQPG